MMRLLFLLPIALAGSQSVKPVRPIATGTYVAVAINGKSMPGVDRLDAANGQQHYLKVEEAVLSLRTNGRFIASARYFHEIVPRGRAASKQLQLLNDTYRGVYTVSGSTITLKAEPSKRQRRPQPVVGTVDGDRIHITHTFMDGAVKRIEKMDLKRDPNVW